MKVIVVNSVPQSHQECVDKALEQYNFKGSPWRKIVSVSTAAAILIERTSTTEACVGLTTTIALNCTSL